MTFPKRRGLGRREMRTPNEATFPFARAERLSEDDALARESLSRSPLPCHLSLLSPASGRASEREREFARRTGQDFHSAEKSAPAESRTGRARDGR